MCASAVSSGGDSAFSYFQSGAVCARACLPSSKSKNINESALTERSVILANLRVGKTVDYVRAQVVLWASFEPLSLSLSLPLSLSSGTTKTGRLVAKRLSTDND